MKNIFKSSSLILTSMLVLLGISPIIHCEHFIQSWWTLFLLWEGSFKITNSVQSGYMYPPIEELKLKLKFPVSSMSLMMVSVVTFPSSLTKKSCSITEAETVRREGSLRRSFPNLVGWLGYWVRQYSSRAHWDFSCSCSITGGEVRPTASENILISWELWRDFKIAWDLFDEIFSNYMIFFFIYTIS